MARLHSGISAGLSRAYDENLGGLRLGDGGTVYLIPADLLAQSVIYLLTRRGSDPVDVSLWRFTSGRGAGELFLSSGGVGAHRGEISAMDVGDTGGGSVQGAVSSWKPALCGSPIGWLWGEFAPCVFPDLAMGEGEEWSCSTLHGAAPLQSRLSGHPRALDRAQKLIDARNAKYEQFWKES